MRKLFPLIVLLILCIAPASFAHAQDIQWRERSTSYFSILYADGSETQAETYAGFIDPIFEEITGTFGHRPATPISFLLYPDLESYYQANPRARGMEGIIAHTDFRRNEVVVILPQADQQSDTDRTNTIRHELTHMIAADLSENRLNAGFQEGIAQFLEKPAPEFNKKIELLERALTHGVLLPWSAFDDRGAIYRNTEVSYPQTLSVIAYLVQRTSFSRVIDFLTMSANSSGYRSALGRAFAASPDDLEKDWLAWLPSYIASARGGTTAPSGATYDMARAEQLISDGSYSDAVAELEAALAGLRAAGREDDATNAERLLQRARAGVEADRLIRGARSALVTAEYTQAAELVAQARAAYGQIADTRQDPVLEDYAIRAERGSRAAQQLQEAASLAETLRYPQARTLVDQALAAYTALGDHKNADQALELRNFLDQRQSFIGGILLILGVGGVIISLARRMFKPEHEPW